MPSDLPPMTNSKMSEIAERLANTSPGMTFDITMDGSTLRATADTENPHRIVAGISDLVATFTGGSTGPVTATFVDDEDGQDATFALNAANDIRSLLDENARLNAENDEARRELAELTADQFANIQLHVQASTTHYEEQIRSLAEKLAARDRTVEALSARLAAKNTELDKVIREAAADKAKLAAVRALHEALEVDWTGGRSCRVCRGPNGSAVMWPCATIRALEPAPEMPRPPAEEADPELIARNDAVDVYSAAHSEYNPYVCVRTGCGHYMDLHAPGCGVCDCSGALRAAPEPANGTAQPGAGDAGTSGTGSGRGTGVTEAPGATQKLGEES